MKPAPFEYIRPASLDEAIGALEDGGWEASPLAGGQSLIPAMNFRLAEPALLVDLGAIGELRGIEATADGGLRIGAMTPQRTVEMSDAIRQRAPLVAEAMPWIAHPQIRNRGTIGGSLAHADPAAELPAVMLALGASFVLRGSGGERTVPAREFYLGLFTTALEPGELLVGVEIPPPPPGSRVAFAEVSRRHGDFALAGVALAVRMAGEVVEDVAVGLFGVGEGPIVSAVATERLVGRELSDRTIAETAAAVTADLDPPGDIHATPAFRRHLAGVLTRRALEQIREQGP